MRDITKLIGPPQLSQEWRNLRYDSANSSSYITMMNIYNNRKMALYDAAKRNPSKPSFYTRYGNVLENMSDAVFTELTGLTFGNLSSISHEQYPRIRGSVDGYGQFNNGQTFILETKTPATKLPSPNLNDYGYYCQIIQNIEILDADCALFNNVFMHPLVTEYFDIPKYANYVKSNARAICNYNRYNMSNNVKFASAISGNVLFISDEKNEYDNFIESITDKTHNYSDLINYDMGGNKIENHRIYREDTLFNYLFMSEKYIVIPCDICNDYDQMIWLNSHNEKKIYFRIDTVNIECIRRQKKFWETILVPIALKWIEDLDNVKNGIEIANDNYKNPIILPNGIYMDY
jgi:hypothetical protein